MASETTSYVYLATNPEKSMFSLFIALDLPEGTGFEIAGPDSIGQVTIFEVKPTGNGGGGVSYERYDLDNQTGLLSGDTAIQVVIKGRGIQKITLLYADADVRDELPEGEIAYECPYICLPKSLLQVQTRRLMVLIPSLNYKTSTVSIEQQTLSKESDLLTKNITLEAVPNPDGHQPLETLFPIVKDGQQFKLPVGMSINNNVFEVVVHTGEGQRKTRLRANSQ